MKTHKMIHTGERPFKQLKCSGAFKKSGHMKTHERTHTGQRRFNCLRCDKVFTESGNCKTHERTHKVEKPFPFENVIRHLKRVQN